MNAPFSNLYLALHQHLIDKIPELKYLARDIGQLNLTKPSLLYPATLIDFDRFKFENLSENVQTASGNVVLKIVVLNDGVEVKSTPDEWRQKSLSGFELEQKVHTALQGFQPEGFGMLNRCSTNTIPRKDNLHVREVIYSIAFEDYSCRPGFQMTPYRLNLQSDMQV